VRPRTSLLLGLVCAGMTAGCGSDKPAPQPAQPTVTVAAAPAEPEPPVVPLKRAPLVISVPRALNFVDPNSPDLPPRPGAVPKFAGPDDPDFPPRPGAAPAKDPKGAAKDPEAARKQLEKDIADAVAKAEASALADIPEPFPRPDRAPEANRAQAAVDAVARAELVMKAFSPPERPTVKHLDPTEMHVGDHGFIDVSCRTIDIQKDYVILRPPGRGALLFAMTGVDTSTIATGHRIKFTDEVEAYAVGDYGYFGRLIKVRYTTPQKPDPVKEGALTAAKAKYGLARAASDRAEADRQEAKAAAIEKAAAVAAAKAKEQVPQPDEDPVAKPTNDEISQARARRRQTEFRLMNEAKAAIEKRFGLREARR
jgi:hypothetical protein